MGRMIDHKHARQPRRQERVAPVARNRHAAIFCSACRMVLLCPIVEAFGKETVLYPGAPWSMLGTHHFCSDECRRKGIAEPVREPAPAAHVRFGPDVSHDERRGFWDALLGYDCVGAHPKYVKGHANGSELRKVVVAAAAELAKGKPA